MKTPPWYENVLVFVCQLVIFVAFCYFVSAVGVRVLNIFPQVVHGAACLWVDTAGIHSDRC